MANDEVIGPRKTMFVLVIVVGCFAVLWPRILSPLVLGPTREQIQPNQFDREAGCCEVIFETDVAVLELVNEVCSSAMGVGKLLSHSVAECRKAVNDTCGVDIAVFVKRNENIGKTTKMLVETMQNSNSSCLREHFGVPIYSLGPHLAANSWNIKDTLKQERAPPMRGLGPHPALRERGRAIPPGPPGPPPVAASRPVTLPPHIRVRSPLSVYYEDEQPPPIPGMRPPLGSPGGPVPAPKSSMGFVMPIYTICIIVFFVYTLTKILFRRQDAPYDHVDPDPQFRRRVFRDDSRSSPEKLGKKEADTIVTAISGLVAEVQQQMEASGAPNQQRQDVQDNARPYTNGTILLNSGPVQIVTSEYKEASKEKTPEPVREKESTPEPKEAEPIKVDKEPCSEVDESVSKPKESIPEAIEPSPEPGNVLQENEAISETVAHSTTLPEPTVTEECRVPIPKLNESDPKPDVPRESFVEPNLKRFEAEESISESLSISEVKEPTPQSKESTPELEVLLDSTSKSNATFAEPIPISEVSKDITLISDSKETSSGRSSPEIKEYFPESKVLATEPEELLTQLVESTEPKEYSSGPKEITFELKEPSLEPVDSSTQPKLISSEPEELFTEPRQLLLESKELASELKDSLSLLKESSTKEPDEPFVAPKELEPKEPIPELQQPSLDSVTSTHESKETLLETEEPIPKPKELPLESEEPAPLLEKSSPQPKESLTHPEDPLIEPKEPSLEPKELTTDIKEFSLDLVTTIPEPIQTLSEPQENVILPKELLLELNEPTAELIESSSIPAEFLSDSKDSFIEPVELSLESKKNTSELKEPLPESIPGIKESPGLKDSDVNAGIPNLSQSIHESDVIILENIKNTVNIDQSVPQHKESDTLNESTPVLLENSQEAKPPIVECSPESELIEHSPKIIAPVVEFTPETELTEHSPKVEAPIVECSSETELPEHSPEVDAPGIDYNSDLNLGSIRLKESTPQFKETTPERKVSEEPKTVQVEENASVTEKTLLDLEEAVADLDEVTSKQQENISEDIKADLKILDQIDQEATEELLKVSKGTDAANDVKDDLVKANDKFLQEERFVVVRQSTPDVIEENKKSRPHYSTPADDYKLYTEADEEDIENAAVKVMGMEMTAHPADGGEWPRDERPPPPASPAPPSSRAPHAAEEVKSIFLETEIPQQSRVLVAQFEEDRPRPAAHSPLVVSGKMTLSLIQDTPRDTPDRDPESTLDEFTTASAVTQPAAEKDELESDEEIDEEIEVEEIEIEEEEEEEEEEPPPVKTAAKK